MQQRSPSRKGPGPRPLWLCCMYLRPRGQQMQHTFTQKPVIGSQKKTVAEPLVFSVFMTAEEICCNCYITCQNTHSWQTYITRAKRLLLVYKCLGNKSKQNANSACTRNEKQAAINQFNFEPHWFTRLLKVTFCCAEKEGMDMFFSIQNTLFVLLLHRDCAVKF